MGLTPWGAEDFPQLRAIHIMNGKGAARLFHPDRMVRLPVGPLDEARAGYPKHPREMTAET